MPDAHQAIVVKTAALVDGTGDPPLRDTGILIESNRFVRIAPWTEGSWPSGERVLMLEANWQRHAPSELVS